MRLMSPVLAVAFAMLALAGCSTTAADNTTYARPPATSGFQIPID